MSKKRKQNIRTSHHPKMPFLNKLLRHDAPAVKKDNQPSDEKSCSAPTFIPSAKALIYASELEYIAKCIQDFPNIETGGQLFGAWTASGTPRVIYAIGPGPKALQDTTLFGQDIEYLQTIGSKLKEYGIQHIGEWHSHHHLGLPNPSRHDVQTMQNSINQLNLNRLILCIGSFNNRGIVINPFNFGQGAHYISSQWDIINTRNRLREVIDNDLASMLCNPSSSSYTFAEEYITRQSQPVSNQSGWFSQRENRQAFKQIIDALKAQTWINEVSPQITSDGIVTLKIVTRTFAEIITFPTNFPNCPFEIERLGLIEGTCTHYSFGLDWVLTSNLQQTFKENYDLHLRKHQ